MSDDEVAVTADFSFFAWARVFQTISLPFLFVPITAAAYTGLPPGKTDEASSLVNVARNLGGSIGISITTTTLPRDSQVHQDYLVAHLAPSSPQYQQALRSATDMLLGQGMPPVQAQSAAIGFTGFWPTEDPNGPCPVYYSRESVEIARWNGQRRKLLSGRQLR